LEIFLDICSLRLKDFWWVSDWKRHNGANHYIISTSYSRTELQFVAVKKENHTCRQCLRSCQFTRVLFRFHDVLKNVYPRFE